MIDRRRILPASIALATLIPASGCCVVYSANTVRELVDGKGRESLYFGTRAEWGDLDRIWDGCFPIGIVWSIDLPFTALLDSLLVPFAFIPVGEEEEPRLPRSVPKPDRPDSDAPAAGAPK